MIEMNSFEAVKTVFSVAACTLVLVAAAFIYGAMFSMKKLNQALKVMK